MRKAICLLFAAVVLVSARRSSADEPPDKRACIRAHEEAQRGRLDGRLRDARASAITCSSDGCPHVIRVECASFLESIDAALPTVLIEVRGAGAQIVDVELAVDGATVLDRLDGRPVPLDPGEHRIAVRHRDGRSAEERVVVFEGEQSRRIVLELPPLTPPPATDAVMERGHALDRREARSSAPPLPSSSSDARTPGRDELHRREERASGSPLPWTFYGAGTLGAAGLVTFAVFGLMGFREQVTLEASCAPRCAPGRETPMRTDYVVADVGLVLGLIGIGGATWVALAR